MYLKRILSCATRKLYCPLQFILPGAFRHRLLGGTLLTPLLKSENLHILPLQLTHFIEVLSHWRSIIFLTLDEISLYGRHLANFEILHRFIWFGWGKFPSTSYILLAYFHNYQREKYFDYDSKANSAFCDVFDLTFTLRKIHTVLHSRSIPTQQFILIWLVNLTDFLFPLPLQIFVFFLIVRYLEIFHKYIFSLIILAPDLPAFHNFNFLPQ